VQLILLYLETVGEAEPFVHAARRVARKKPIIAVKSGRSDAGAAAAVAHWLDRRRRCRRRHAAGAVRRAAVENFRDMFALAGALLQQPPPAAPRMAVITTPAAPASSPRCADRCGLQMAVLQPATERRCARRCRRSVGAQPRRPDRLADAARYRAALRAVMRDPQVAGLLVLFVSPS